MQININRSMVCSCMHVTGSECVGILTRDDADGGLHVLQKQHQKADDHRRRSCSMC